MRSFRGLCDQARRAPVEFDEVSIGGIDAFADKAEPVSWSKQRAIQGLALAVGKPPGYRARRSV